VATVDAPPGTPGTPGTPSPQSADPAAAGKSGAPQASPGGKQRPVLRWVIAVEALIVLFAVGFFFYLFALSSVSEQRSQAVMFKTFRGELGQALAPVGPTTEGSPVAVLNIPQIGLRDVVVVEGTTTRDLTHGPGHVRASALPGQGGVSFIYGKAVTFGAPFAHLMQLNRGDRFTVTTGQGTATYVVESFGTSKRPAPGDSFNRLVLETAGPGLFPSEAVQVSADLVSKPQANPGGWPAISSEEVDMAWDSDSLIPLMLWSQALLLVVIVATLATNLWSRWPAYACAAPVIIAVLWCVYENLAASLPNLY
jgi:sortase A